MSMIAVLSVMAVLTAQDAQAREAPAAAVAVPPAAELTPEQQAEEDRLDEVTCRTEAVVGSRFNSRVCMTRREWNQRRDESRRLAHRLDVQNSNRDRVQAPGH